VGFPEIAREAESDQCAIATHVRAIDGAIKFGWLPTYYYHQYAIENGTATYTGTTSSWDIGCPCDECKRRRKTKGEGD
jgi:hypothetical protein